jgi:hypothetical protein
MRWFAMGMGLSLLAGCGPNPQQRTVDLLHQRLHRQMAGPVQAGYATVQDLPDGAVVTFPERRFAAVADPRVNLVEALLDPALLRIAIAPPSNLPPYEADRRVQAWRADFTRMQIGQALQPPSVTPPVTPLAAPYSMTVAIQVVCPDHGNNTWGYTNGARQPGCY